jgi:putative flippase GtrA
MLDGIQPLFTARFVKFCAVGASGVLVNLGTLGLLADGLGLQVNAAAALAILVSINTNFAINELWTFRDRRAAGDGGLGRRWLRFHLVSLAGGAIQWLVFVGANLAFASLLGAQGSQASAGVRAAVLDPGDVGAWKYLSQLAGIGVATLWNYFANFHWTWKRDGRRQER